MKIDCEVIFERHVTCDGGNAEMGHPKVALEVSKLDPVADFPSVECPYCGKKFFYKESVE